jgi:hypothetical protein
VTAPESPVAAQPEAARLGTASIQPATPIVAGSRGTWRVTFTCGPQGIATGGGLRFYTDSDTDWGVPQVHDAAGAEYLTVAAPAASMVGLKILDEKQVALLVLGAPLRPGDSVTLTIGDRSGGGPGSRAQTFAEPRRAFLVDVDGDGTGRWTPIPEPPRVAVVGGAAERLTVVAPSTVRPGEPFGVLVRAIDAWGNPAQTWEGVAELSGGALELPESRHAFGAADGGVWWLDGCRVTAPGVYRI